MKTCVDNMREMKTYKVTFCDWYETYERVIKAKSKDEAIAFVENVGSIRNIRGIEVISVVEVAE